MNDLGGSGASNSTEAAMDRASSIGFRYLPQIRPTSRDEPAGLIPVSTS